MRYPLSGVLCPLMLQGCSSGSGGIVSPRRAITMRAAAITLAGITDERRSELIDVRLTGLSPHPIAKMVWESRHA